MDRIYLSKETEGKRDSWYIAFLNIKREDAMRILERPFEKTDFYQSEKNVIYIYGSAPTDDALLKKPLYTAMFPRM